MGLSRIFSKSCRLLGAVFSADPALFHVSTPYATGVFSSFPIAQAIASGRHGTVVVSFSPEARASLASHLRLPMAAFAPRAVTFFKSLGAHLVTDTSAAHDVTLLEVRVTRFVGRWPWCDMSARCER